MKIVKNSENLKLVFNEENAEILGIKSSFHIFTTPTTNTKRNLNLKEVKL